MTAPVRFPYAGPDSDGAAASVLAYLPITLSHEANSLAVSGLVDSGSTVNVLPYSLGLQLVYIWEQQTLPVRLTGNPARSRIHE